MLEELPKNFSSIAALSIWLIELGIGGIMKRKRPFLRHAL
jgi:hypothetical protein